MRFLLSYRATLSLKLELNIEESELQKVSFFLWQQQQQQVAFLVMF